MEIFEYDYYEGSVSITIVSKRPDVQASVIVPASSVHEEWASRVRVALREFRSPLDAYLSYYSVRKIQPGASIRDVDTQLNQDLTRIQFDLGIAMIEAAWIGDETKVFAFERNLEKAVKDLFTARGGFPPVFVPGDDGVKPDDYIDVIVTMGPGSNIGQWQTNAAP